MTGRGLGRFALATSVLLAACGGSTTPPAAPTTSTGSTAAPGATANQATAAPQTGVTVATPPANQNGSGSGFTADPCSLLTAAEIEAATGVKNAVGNPTPMHDDKGACLWIGDDATMGAGVEIATGAKAVSNWDVAKHDGEPEALPGIGDDAVYSGVLETVFFLKNGVLFAVVAGPFFSEAATKKAAGIELAKVILGKL